jgi:outer membrane protein OmpA-like peptidoglycan-associated protein
LDTVDKCPNEPEDFDGFEDNDGCPETDNDRDGLADANDRCPNQPEDKDGFQDEDGCPDPDNDRDGIPDLQDKCPNEPEDKDNFEDQDGCPDPDNDRDGIPDVADKCPNEPENYNGYRDEDGCPDIVFTCTEFIIPEKVYFKTASARIMKKSFALLDVVAETINKSPEAALTEIQGHSDKRGSRRYNLKLSDRRAKSVMQYMLNKGVSPERLSFKGYGFDKPFEEGKVAREFFEKNRRVQFIVLRIDPTRSKKCQK